MCFHSDGDKDKGVAALLAAGFDYRQHDKPTVASALRAEGELPPDHRMTQRALARVVRRLDPFVPQERPQPLAMFVQLPAHPPHIAIVALHSAQQQLFYLAADRTRPTHQHDPQNPTLAIISPMLKQHACRTSQMLSKPFRARVARVDHCLKIAWVVNIFPVSACPRRRY